MIKQDKEKNNNVKTMVNIIKINVRILLSMKYGSYKNYIVRILSVIIIRKNISGNQPRYPNLQKISYVFKFRNGQSSTLISIIPNLLNN